MRNLHEIESILHDMVFRKCDIPSDSNLIWELLEHARRGREQEAKEIIKGFLALDDWSDEAIASSSFVDRAKYYIRHPKTTCVIVSVEGGIVQSVYTDNPDGIAVEVLDFDNLEDPQADSKCRDLLEVMTEGMVMVY